MTETAQTEKEALKRKNSLEKSAVGIVDETLNIGSTRLRDEHSKVSADIVGPSGSELHFANKIHQKSLNQ